MKAPTISAAVRVHNGERYVAETLTAILSQTRAPDEVVVIDDGSTDGTPGELERFGREIRVVRQDNGGYADAFNRSFAEARGEYVANCDADDVWEPGKLERQAAALEVHPEIDVAFAATRFFGARQGPFNDFSTPGLQEPDAFARRLYWGNRLCTSSTLIRRALFERVGPFRGERSAECEDYDYWLRALAAGAVFFFDPGPLVRYRVHSDQASQSQLRIHQGEYRVHRWHADLVADRGFASRVLARDLSNIARALSDLNRPREARAAFASSFRQRPTPRVLAWILVLSAPDRYRRRLADRLVSVKRALRSGGSATLADPHPGA
jgi:glycosyltransferase involved in cell wall biosynthesis